MKEKKYPWRFLVSLNTDNEGKVIYKLDVKDFGASTDVPFGFVEDLSLNELVNFIENVVKESKYTFDELVSLKIIEFDDRSVYNDILPYFKSYRDYGKGISYLNVFANNEDEIKVGYSDGTVEYRNVSEFYDLVNDLIDFYGDTSLESNDIFSELVEDGVITFNLDYDNTNENDSVYNDKKISKIKIKSNGDVIIYTPFRKKLNFEKDSKDIYDALSAICVQNKKDNYDDLLGSKIKLKTAKKKTVVEEEKIPYQLLFGKYVDKEGNINYKYFALYDDLSCEEIQKKEAVDYFNKIAKKKKVTDKKIDKMFEKEYCKILPLSKLDEYIASKEEKKKSKFFGRKKKKSKGVFKSRVSKLAAVATAIVLAGSGIIAGFISKFSKKQQEVADKYKTAEDLENKNQYSSDVISSDLDNVIIKNSAYNGLLKECAGNYNRKNAMKAVGAYFEKYNNLNFVKERNSELTHSFDEIFYEYLAYNDIYGTQFNDIFGQENLSISDFKDTLAIAIEKDAKAHTIQTEPMEKELIISSLEGEELYKKYESLFININNEKDEGKKVEYATSFYEMVRDDLPGMKTNSYLNVKKYMYIIEEFRVAMEKLAINTNNKFTQAESNYISGILDEVIVEELSLSNTSNQAQFVVDSYYSNEYVEYYPTIDAFRNAISELETEKQLVSDDKKNDNKNSKGSQNGKNDTSNAHSSEQEYNSNSNSDIDYSVTIPVEDTETIITDNIPVDEDNVVVDSIPENIESNEGSLIINGNCEIIDNNQSDSEIVEGTLSPDDMIIVEEEIVVSPSSPSEDVSTDVVEDVPLEEEYYGKGVVDENGVVHDYYEDVGQVPEEDVVIYDQNDPLPDPNNIETTSSNMTNEQLADAIVEQMASVTSFVDDAKIYQL